MPSFIARLRAKWPRYIPATRAAQLFARARFAGNLPIETAQKSLFDSVLQHFTQKKGISGPLFRNSIRLSVATYIKICGVSSAQGV
jgi:hypothetical protein